MYIYMYIFCILYIYMFYKMHVCKALGYMLQAFTAVEQFSDAHLSDITMDGLRLKA